MPLLIIIADDLTGAADSAARCHAAGLAATIIVAPQPGSLPAGAVAFSSDSRHLPPEQAAARVRALVAKINAPGTAVWYKKIDSTLRGNLGAELDALLDALGRRVALVCPAFPAQGRGIAGGYLVGAPGGNTPHLPSLLAQQSRHAVAHLPLEVVRSGAHALAAQLVQAHAPLVVADALDEDDLRTLVEAARSALPNALLCGSAGLVGALAVYRRDAEPRPEPVEGVQRQAAGGRRQAAGGEAAACHTLYPIPYTPSSVLVVVGSGSATARRQVAYLRQSGEAEAGMEAAPYRILCLGEPPAGLALDGSEARAAAGRLAEAALAQIERLQPALLLLVGGDTAISVLARLGVARLRVLRELLPGMPLAQAVDATGRGYAVILKAGNHGGDDALHVLLRSFAGWKKGK